MVFAVKKDMTESFDIQENLLKNQDQCGYAHRKVPQKSILQMAPTWSSCPLNQAGLRDCRNQTQTSLNIKVY